jgi:hypothetical protein
VLTVLPLIALLLLIAACATGFEDRRDAILAGAVAWGVVLTAMTEILSMFHLLTATWIAASWAVVSLALAPVGWRGFRGLARPLPRIAPIQALLLLGVGLILLVTGLIALIAPPNTWDAMTYHMARVMQWVQHRSVAYYPAHTPMQLYRPPWTEFAVLHVQLLSHGDRFSNLVQWFGMLGSLAGVSLITKRLGGGPPAQLAAAVLTATLPMGIMQASSTQTDFAAAFWLVCFVAFSLPHFMSPRPQTAGLPLSGASLGLAILTKPTAYMYASPFLLWIAIAAVSRHRQKWLLHIIVVLLIASAINLGHYRRNVDLYGHPIGPADEELCSNCGLLNDAVTVPLFVSNVLRNASLHLGTPFPPLNGKLEVGIARFHSLMGISSNDPRATWRDFSFSILPPLFDEDHDGNLLHFGLVALTVLCLLTVKRIRSAPFLLPYALALIGGFVVFNLAMKWQPFHSRLHLSLFVLWSPLIGIVLSHLRSRSAEYSVLFVALVLSFPWIVFNYARPLIAPPVGFICETIAQHAVHCSPRRLRFSESPSIFMVDRSRLYFRKQPALETAYAAAMRSIRQSNCDRVGLRKDWNAWEYPLWVLADEPHHGRMQMEHLDVNNASARLSREEPFRSYRPCAILSIVDDTVTVTGTESTPTVPFAGP